MGCSTLTTGKITKGRIYPAFETVWKALDNCLSLWKVSESTSTGVVLGERHSPARNRKGWTMTKLQWEPISCYFPMKSSVFIIAPRVRFQNWILLNLLLGCCSNFHSWMPGLEFLAFIVLSIIITSYSLRKNYPTFPIGNVLVTWNISCKSANTSHLHACNAKITWKIKFPADGWQPVRRKEKGRRREWC